MNITRDRLAKARYLVQAPPSTGFVCWWVHKHEAVYDPAHTAEIVVHHSSKVATYTTLLWVVITLICGIGVSWRFKATTGTFASVSASITLILTFLWRRRMIVHQGFLASLSEEELAGLDVYHEELLRLRRLSLPLDEKLQGDVCFLANVRSEFARLKDRRRVEVERELISLGIDPEPT